MWKLARTPSNRRHLQHKEKTAKNICSNFFFTVELHKAYATGFKTPFINTSHIVKRIIVWGAYTLAEQMWTTIYGNHRTMKRSNNRTPVLATLYSLDKGRCSRLRFRGQMFLSISPQRILPCLVCWPLLEGSLLVFCDTGAEGCSPVFEMPQHVMQDGRPVEMSNFPPSWSYKPLGLLFLALNSNCLVQLSNDESSMLELYIVCSSLESSFSPEKLASFAQFSFKFAFITLSLRVSEINLQSFFFAFCFVRLMVDTLRECLRITKKMRIYVKTITAIGMPNPTTAR